jgi:hypothetical protein
MFFRLKMHAKAGDADRISKVLQDVEISMFFREWVSGGAHAWGYSITAVAKRDCTRCGRERPSAGTPIARRERCREARSRRGTARANLDL